MGIGERLTLLFSALAEGVSYGITGSANLDNLLRNVAAVEKGPLPDDVVAGIRARWAEAGKDDQGGEFTARSDMAAGRVSLGVRAGGQPYRRFPLETDLQ